MLRTLVAVQLDDPTPPEALPCSVHTFVRPLERFPPNFETRAKSNAKGFIMPTKNERVLLNSFLGKYRLFNPGWDDRSNISSDIAQG